MIELLVSIGFLIQVKTVNLREGCKGIALFMGDIYGFNLICNEDERFLYVLYFNIIK